MLPRQKTLIIEKPYISFHPKIVSGGCQAAKLQGQVALLNFKRHVLNDLLVPELVDLQRSWGRCLSSLGSVVLLCVDNL